MAETKNLQFSEKFIIGPSQLDRIGQLFIEIQPVKNGKGKYEGHLCGIGKKWNFINLII